MVKSALLKSSKEKKYWNCLIIGSIFVLVFSCTVNGQNSNKSLYFISTLTVDNTFQKPSVNFKKVNFNTSSFDLHIYNSSLGLFENYIYIADNQYEKSDKMFLNYSHNYYFNSTPNSLLNVLTGRHIDSFNPYGVSNLGEAFALGLFNTFFGKNEFSIKR